MFNDNSTKKRMVWPWDHPYEQQWKMFYDLFMNWTVSEQIETGFCKEDLLMIILFYLNQLNLSQNLMRILIYSMLICIFHWKEDKIISCPFYMWKFFDNKVNLIQQFIENLLLAAYIFILVVVLPIVYKLGMIYAQACRCFKAYSKRTKFYEELNFPEKAYF